MVVSLAASCTPADDTPGDRPITRLAEKEAPLQRVLCQLSAGGFGDRDPQRRDVTLDLAEVTDGDATQKGEVIEKAVVGPFRVAVTFMNDGSGAPHLSFGVGRSDTKRYTLHGEMFQLTHLEDGSVARPVNQLGSGFTGTAYIRYPGRDMALTRYCRAF